MSLATSSSGVKLQRGNGATSEQFATIAEVLDLSGPNETMKLIDVSNLSSTFREYITGIKDGGEVSFRVNFVGQDASQQGLKSDMDDKVKRNFKLVLNDDPAGTDNTECAFSALVTEFGFTANTDQALQGNVRLKITGATEWTYFSAGTT